MPPRNLFHAPLVQPQRTNSPFTTPLPPQKRVDYHANGLGSGDTIAVPSDPPSSALAASQNVDKAHHHGTGEGSSPMDSFKSRTTFSNPLGIREDRRNFSNMSSASTIDAPNDATAGPHDERHRQNPYAGLVYASGEPSSSHQPFAASNLHTQHGKPEDRRPELYEGVNFRQIGAYASPLFANGSPIRQEKQRAT